MYQTVYKLEVLNKDFNPVEPSVENDDFVKMALAFAGILNPEIEPEIIDAFYLRDLMSECGVEDWHFAIEDMKELAEKFPDFYFRLSGTGEDELDKWVTCFHKNVFATSHKTEDFEVDDDPFGWTEI